MSIYEPYKCQTYWGSHGCRKRRHHHGGHACGGCGERITPNGLDPWGFAWSMYGDDVEAFVERGGLVITESTPACKARRARVGRVSLSGAFMSVFPPGQRPQDAWQGLVNSLPTGTLTISGHWDVYDTTSPDGGAESP